MIARSQQLKKGKAMTPINTLSAVVRYVDGTGKFSVATSITIMLGTLAIATHTLGGKYSQKQALTEFKRNPQNFTRQEGYSIAKSLKLAA
jgi:hypothetical protein